jgi:endonuclease/exonuclease/phosphatase family metal-dependent hydrolase
MASFDVTCRCGAVIHTGDEHVGRTIRCRCGEPVTIARPATRRTRRGARRFTALFAPFRELRAARPRRRYTAWAQAAYLLGALLAWWLLVTFSERWLPATLLAYGPRGVLLAPLTLLVPAAVLFSWRSLVFSALGAVVVAWPIMGWHPFGVRGDPPSRTFDAATAMALRVVSLNAQGGAVVQSGVPYLLGTYDPDLLMVQECGAPLVTMLRLLPDRHVVAERGLCLVSRWPVTQVDSMPRSTFRELRQLGYGGTALVTHYRIAHPDGALHAVNLHLETARKGLEGLVGEDGLLPDGGAQAIDRLDANVSTVTGTAAANAAVRDAESRAAARWAFERRTCGPLVIAGDFNLPQESTIYRQHWRRFVNAFDAAGHGFGHTKIEGRLLRVRIDHVLTLPEDADVLGAWVGSDVGSDHRPLVADLTVQRGERGWPECGDGVR